MANKLTIKDIAKLAGVSKASVSRVLNGYQHVRPELRERVQKVVAETGYERNTVARLLATDRSNVIGLLIPSGAPAIFTDPYFARLIEGISKAANQHQLTLALFIFYSQEEGIASLQNIISDGFLDGIILSSDYKDDVLFNHLQKASMRFVMIGRPPNNEHMSFSDVDNFGGGRTAANYLIQQGYRRIGIITANHNLAAEDRYWGYRKALDSYGIAFDENLCAEGDFSQQSGSRAMEQLLPHNPDAVFVTSDTMALGALQTAKRHGISVPDDMAVMGFDDLPPAVQADPPLTTIHQPILESGFQAVEALWQMIDNPDHDPVQSILPARLIVRESA
ncbi:MAG: LacI family DNA-binding transcriptional regulator [Chloroflexota bacterium]